MPRVPWGALSQPTTHALIAELDPSFFGGPVASDPFDTSRLREATNLMSRLATRMKLGEAHAVTPSRGANGVERLVLCAYAREADRNSVADLVEVISSSSSDGWASCRTFSLTGVAHELLVKIAGESDNRYAGRRRRERQEGLSRATSLRWGID